ncbi:MAG: DUF4317 domain-containing protein [Eubacterium sp.]|nr:DUF4317 domain-containing protein [Eubacterium sp.]
MNKDEIKEIQKALKKDRCTISKIAECYVGGKEKKTIHKSVLNFISLKEEEVFKYCDLFKKALSGKVGKTLLNLEFPLNEEVNDGKQAFMLKLRDSELRNKELLDDYFEMIKSNYITSSGGNYLILVAFGSYDIPKKGTDGIEMEDASQYVYNYVLTMICPVALNKPGLCYSERDDEFIDKIQDWMVQMPETAILFPAFNDRNTDIHSCLYYNKKSKEPHEELVASLLGCELPTEAESQKEIFADFVENALGRNCDFEAAKIIHEELIGIAAEKDVSGETQELTKQEVRSIMSKVGADQSGFDQIDEMFDRKDVTLLASNVADSKKLVIESEDIKISVDPSWINVLDTKIIDGRECLCIPLSGMKVNGISIKGKCVEER